MSDDWDIRKLTCIYRTGDNLISTNESAFKQGDFCINQFLSATHDSLDYGFYS